jgi:hypothetical protein
MRFNEIIQSDIDSGITIGDVFMVELGDVLIETVVVDLLSDGPVLSSDSTIDSLFKKLGQLKTLNEAEYQGKKVKLNKPFLTPDGPKKRSVYVKNDKGNVVKVNFGDKKLRIKKHNPKRRKSFRARHRCKTPGPKWRARYWSCKFW